ncbi:thioredoxin domain-containing protein [Microbacterium sp. C7(2022)]|uniref:DsbA family protein n=1 Tax=Microbacterium sp. C7(2022) TaxID=2992759 RepID=UPI00237AF354|nr:thioredoxin domain-containing protein [Microbacterium sp. C7(2022)]MDE0547123.1 DsbA family protein [Microbacterium sp. C7(2022)]
MSSDETPNASSPRERRDAVREKAQLVRAQQTRMRLIRAASIAVGAVAVIVAGAVAITMTVSSAASRPLLKPANADHDGFAVVGVEGVGLVTETTPDDAAAASADESPSPTPSASAEDAPAVDIRVYVDYLSTGARDFQLANVQQLSNWFSEDAATVTYYPVAMLTSKSNGTKYSQRAAAAAACVGTHAPDSFFAFNNALLAQQPDVGTDGLNNSELAALAIASGAKQPTVIRECIEDEDFTGWAKEATARALEAIPDTDDLALTSSPTVLVNGQPYVGALGDPKEFAQFVLTIASDAYYQENATPTPTPSS